MRKSEGNKLIARVAHHGLSCQDKSTCKKPSVDSV